MRFRWWMLVGLSAAVASCSGNSDNDDDGDDQGSDGGLVVCSDGGVHGQDGGQACGWLPYNDGLAGAIIVDVMFDTRTAGVVYATGGDTVYQSVDAGHTWHAQGRLGLGEFMFIAMVGRNPTDLMASSSNGVTLSHDGGKTWTPVALQGANVESLTVHPTQPMRAYASIHQGSVMRSDDGGMTWYAIEAGYPYMDTLAMDVDPRNPDVVVTVGQLINESYVTFGGAIELTTDGGQTWQTVYQENAYQYVWNVRRCADDSSVLYAASDAGLLRSVDRGQTWSLSVAPGVKVEDVAIAAKDCNDIFIMSDDGVHRSTDGGHTFGSAVDQGLNLLPFGTWPGRMAVDPTTPDGVVVGNHGGIWFTTSAGAQWTAAQGLLGMQIRGLSASPTDPTRLWLASFGSGVWERSSPQAQWTRMSTQALPDDYFNGVVADPFTPKRVLAASEDGYQSNDDGATFTAAGIEQALFTFAFDPSNPDVFYAVTEINGVYKTANHGGTWSPANGSLAAWPPENSIDVRSIVVDPMVAQTLYIGTYGRGVFKSNDGAATWNNVLAPTEAIGCLLLAPGTPSVVYACVNGAGIQRSADGGGTWTDISQGLPSLDVTGLALDGATGDIYATVGPGVYVKHGVQAWAGVELGCLAGARTPAIVADGNKRWLVVASGGGVYEHPI